MTKTKISKTARSGSGRKLRRGDKRVGLRQQGSKRKH